MRRRAFLLSVASSGAGLATARAAGAQQAPPSAPGANSNLFEMNQEAAKTVRRPAKPGAVASMTADERDKLERGIRCQCGCTLDVYICRTTDFSCQVSPAMHRDIISLVEGGYSAQEILDAFVDTYGEQALMAPKREGFNLAGYIVPFVALGMGAIALVIALKRMQRQPGIPSVADSRAGADARGSDDEMARLDAAIRTDD